MKWNTFSIIAALKTIDGCEVDIGPQGGDHDTTAIIVTKSGINGSIFIRGFDPVKEITTPDHAEIEMIEVTDGNCSSGGLNSNDPEMIQLYADVRKKLTGFTVVYSMKDYF